jgi:hypothetical protein
VLEHHHGRAAQGEAIVLEAGDTETFHGATLRMADSESVDQTACMGATLTIDASVNGG